MVVDVSTKEMIHDPAFEISDKKVFDGKGTKP